MARRDCFFARLGYAGCDSNPLDPCHLVPKQRLKQLFKTRGMKAADIAVAVWDPRVTVPGCRTHHTAFDQKQLRLTVEQYPQKMHDYAAQYALEYRGPRDGWVGTHVEPGGEAA